ncbi:MAG: DUF5714 domain-containing protein [Fibromonadaceae bacterium]|jgi:hypothetical protein|nr:DUF5714 domain-containing protein [Fibromonadaceae bacterium]
MFNSGCVICGDDLEYLDGDIEQACSVCLKKYSSSVKCKSEHFVCDDCHRADAVEYAESYCKNTLGTNPLDMLVEIMKNPKVKMHGPEHHFLVPAVLLACYYNIQNQHEVIGEKLTTAKSRSKNILGGFCSTCGNCGAGVGTGIFMSIINKTTSLSKEEWRLANLMTAKSLENIANNGGPRCCKRDSFLAIESAIDFLEEHLNVKLPKSNIKCEFSKMNKDCKKDECRYF